MILIQHKFLKTGMLPDSEQERKCVCVCIQNIMHVVIKVVMNVSMACFGSTVD
jgi:hypothetical protein